MYIEIVLIVKFINIKLYNIGNLIIKNYAFNILIY